MHRIFVLFLMCVLLAILAAAQESETFVPVSMPDAMVPIRASNITTQRNQDNTFTAHIYSIPKFIQDESGSHEISFPAKNLSAHGFLQAVEAGRYTFRSTPGDPLSGHRFERGKVFVTYTPLGDWTGKTSIITHHYHGIKEDVIISSGAGTSVSWRISTNAHFAMEDGAVIFYDDAGTFQFLIPPPSAFDAAFHDIPVTTTLIDSVLTCTLDMTESVEWPVTLDPSTMVTAQTDGSIKKETATSYATARDSETGNTMGWNYIGQGKTVSSNFRVYRSFLSFPLPEMNSVESCTLYVYGGGDESQIDFDLYLHTASAYGPTLDTGDFPRFDGRKTAANHTGAILNNTWNTSSDYTTSAWNTIVFNSAGRDSIIAVSGGTFRIALISSRDYSNTSPTTNGVYEYIALTTSSITGLEPYLSMDYTPGIESPADFTMTTLDDSTIACSWTDAGSEEFYHLVNWVDSTVIDSLAANAVADTITGLSMNTKYTWAVVADSSGIKGYSLPDSSYTLLTLPDLIDIKIMPISSDTLRISVPEPVNGSADSTGMEVEAVSGSGADNSGMLTGEYAYLDGGLDVNSTYVYRLRLRNGDGIYTGWSTDLSFAMNGLDTLTVFLAGDSHDDYRIAAGTGRVDSTVVRAGASDTGETLDGFLSFTIPWYVQKGGVDSLFLSMTRTDEENSRTPDITLSGIPVKGIAPVETLNLSDQDTTTASRSWEVSGGTGKKTTSNLRDIFREWQDIEPIRDFSYGFGIRLGGGSPVDSVRAVFLDASHPSYDHDSYLTIYYTPGNPHLLDAAPDNFEITVQSPDSITAQWSDNAQLELGYLILNTADSTVVAGTDTLAENTSEIGIGGLTPNTVYDWFVRAFTILSDSSSAADSDRTPARTPGLTTVVSLSDSTLSFVLDPAGNPPYTTFAVQDSLTGFFVDASGDQDTLRAAPLGEWGWQTYAEWGSASGDTLYGLKPDSLYVPRAKARTGD